MDWVGVRVSDDVRVYTFYFSQCLYTRLAATAQTPVIAQLGARWLAVLSFMGSRIESRQVNFFLFYIVFCLL